MSTSKKSVNPEAVYEYQQEADLLNQERGAIIKAAIERLQYEERLALCFYLTGATREGIGEILGCSHTWAQKLYTRAVDKIRDDLRKQKIYDLSDLK